MVSVFWKLLEVYDRLLLPFDMAVSDVCDFIISNSSKLETTKSTSLYVSFLKSPREASSFLSKHGMMQTWRICEGSTEIV